MAALYDILEEVRAQIQALHLPQIPSANIVIQKAISARVKDLPSESLPCILVAPFGAETVAPGSNLRDDVTYPVLVAVCASEKSENQQPQSEQEDRHEMYLGWRESIRKAFSNQRLTPTLVHNITVAPLSIVERTAFFDDGLYVQGLVLRCTNRESRS